MKVQLYTLSEITETLRTLSKERDSIKAVLGAGDFRTKFENSVKEIRTKRESGGLPTLTERLVPMTSDSGEVVYLLDDIQMVVTKQQFTKLIKFLHEHEVPVSMDQPTYVPQPILELFIKSENTDPLGDFTALETEDEAAVLKFI